MKPLCFASYCLGCLLAVVAATAQASDWFEAPQALKADGEFIDTGDTGGHAGPCLVDLDQDGRRDLVVGDFKGKFRYFRNIGTDTAPKYTYRGFLQSEGEDAQTKVYCCIAASPYFCDLNGDGLRDMISGCYSPGSIWWFPGIQGNDDPLQLGPKRQLTDQTGKVIIPNSHSASFPVAVDWDYDGDLDLVYGAGGTNLWLRRNLGTPQEPVFESDDKKLTCDDGQGGTVAIKLPRGHAAVTVADWDQDGLLDVLSGCYDGGVYWFRNGGSKQEAKLAAPQTLVTPTAAEGVGFNRPHVVGADPFRGSRTQIFVADYNLDGQLDLLVGDVDVTVEYVLKSDLSDQAQRRFVQIAQEQYETLESYSIDQNRIFLKLRDEFQGANEAMRARWDEINLAWENEPAQIARQARGAALLDEMQAYLDPLAGKPTQRHRGHVWLFLRKSGAAKTLSSAQGGPVSGKLKPT